MFKSITRLFTNPTVRRLIVWAAPFILSWIMKKLEKSSKSSPTKKRK